MNGPAAAHTLAEYLSSALGEPVRVDRLARVAMGQSRAMYLLDGAVGGVDRRLVVRVEQHGMLGSDSTTEVPVMRALFRAGFPVAEVLAYEPTGDVLGQPFFVMSFVEGVSTEDPATLDEYLRLLHRLHHFDPAELGLDALTSPPLPTGPAHTLLDRWEQTYRSGLVGEPSPLLEEAIAHLRRTAPATDRLCIVPADPGPGNYMHLDGRVTALVDWEFTHLGDEYDDWAYLIHMRGRRALTPDEWIDRIHRVTGVEIDRERLHYWRGVNHLMGAAIDQTCTKLYHDRVVPVPNLLAIGTGVHLSALRRLYDVVLA